MFSPLLALWALGIFFRGLDFDENISLEADLLNRATKDAMRANGYEQEDDARSEDSQTSMDSWADGQGADDVNLAKDFHFDEVHLARGAPWLADGPGTAPKVRLPNVFARRLYSSATMRLDRLPVKTATPGLLPPIMNATATTSACECECARRRVDTE